MVTAAIIAALTSAAIAGGNAYMSSKKPPGFATGADVGGGNKTPFQIPQNYFGSPGSTSLLGSQKPELSQALGAGQGQPPPTYGSSAGPTPFDQMALQQKIQGMSRGK